MKSQRIIKIRRITTAAKSDLLHKFTALSSKSGQIISSCKSLKILGYISNGYTEPFHCMRSIPNTHTPQFRLHSLQSDLAHWQSITQHHYRPSENYVIVQLKGLPGVGRQRNKRPTKLSDTQTKHCEKNNNAMKVNCLNKNQHTSTR